eukprot:7384493-Prymnesium_polylepis.2
MYRRRAGRRARRWNSLATQLRCIRVACDATPAVLGSALATLPEQGWFEGHTLNLKRSPASTCRTKDRNIGQAPAPLASSGAISHLCSCGGAAYEVVASKELLCE